VRRGCRPVRGTCPRHLLPALLRRTAPSIASLPPGHTRLSLSLRLSSLSSLLPLSCVCFVLFPLRVWTLLIRPINIIRLVPVIAARLRAAQPRVRRRQCTANLLRRRRIVHIPPPLPPTEHFSSAPFPPGIPRRGTRWGSIRISPTLLLLLLLDVCPVEQGRGMRQTRQDNTYTHKHTHNVAHGRGSGTRMLTTHIHTHTHKHTQHTHNAHTRTHSRNTQHTHIHTFSLPFSSHSFMHTNTQTHPQGSWSRD
jgi:hypothetical protein